MPFDNTKLDTQHLVSWPWPAALLGNVPGQSGDGSTSPEGRLLLVTPTAHGLDALESSGCVLSALWVLAADTDSPGTLLGYRVEEIANLESTTPGGRKLTVLRGPGNQLIAIEGHDLFVPDSDSIQWKDSGQYKHKHSSSKA